MTLSAVLIDTVSIQEYVYSSNKLKENIGASFLVKKIYDDVLKEALKQTFGKDIDINEWRKPKEIKIAQGNDEVEIGYIGGGNALVLFKDKDKTLEFIKNYTKLLLIKTPGLRTAFGVSHDFDLNNFENSMENLHKNLRENKNQYFPNVTLPKYGFTLDCPRTNESAEAFEDEDKKFISSVSRAKLKYSDEAKNEIMNEGEIINEGEMTNKIKDILKDKYTLTNDIRKLGQQKGKDYIAIVFIDGNKMSEKFANCKNIEEYRELSIKVKNITVTAFRKMIEKLIYEIENNEIFKNGEFKLEEEDGKTVLPIRPIVLGGDDITFISDGRLGVWLAEIFIKEFTNQNIDNEHGLSACGGVSIVKTKYPFYRAYKLAEDLLEMAKKKSREEDGSYIDFFISSAGWSGSLEDILVKHLSTVNGKLHFGPYRVDSTTDEKSIDNLKNIIKGFKNIPKNKLMKLREMLFEDKNIAKIYVEELKVKGINLPRINGMQFHKDLWQDEETPYFDAIELIDFYPEGLL